MDKTVSSLVLADCGATEYVIVYSESESSNIITAKLLAQMLKEATGVDFPIVADSGVPSAKEILIGEVNREYVSAAKTLLRPRMDYTISVCGDNLVFLATSASYYYRMMTAFKEQFLDTIGNDKLVIQESDGYIYHTRGGSFATWEKDTFADDYHALYGPRGISVYHDMQLDVLEGKKSLGMTNMTVEDISDQRFVLDLVKRIGNCAVFHDGSTNALWNGKFHKLNFSNYQDTMLVRDGTVWIPKDFAQFYFGRVIAAVYDGYVNLNRLCQESDTHQLWYCEQRKIAIIQANDVAPFEPLQDSHYGHTNKEYLDRIEEFFRNPLPDALFNTMDQTRIVVGMASDRMPLPKKVLDIRDETYSTCYSPSIIVTQQDGKKILYASYENSTIAAMAESQPETLVLKSLDGGLTWTEIGRTPKIYWASLFELNGTVYLMGRSTDKPEDYKESLANAYTIISAYYPDGSSKTVQFRLANAPLAPNSTVVHNGRLYVSCGSSLASISVDDDLLVPQNWTVSIDANTLIDNDWYCAHTGREKEGLSKLILIEGTVFLGGDDKIYYMFRLDIYGNKNCVVVFEASADGRTLTRVPCCDGFVRIPTTITKLTVRYDEKTNRYIAIVNPFTEQTAWPFARNVVALVSSPDLLHWDVHDVLLSDREIMNPKASGLAHAFQYISFAIDDEDLVLVVREATGYTNWFHDGKFCAFYRLRRFRDVMQHTREWDF